MITQKQVDLGNGCTINLASLTFDQVEELLNQPVPEEAAASRLRSWHEVMMCVNNYPGQEALTRKDISTTLSGCFPALEAVMKLNDLRREALILSGYSLDKKGEQPTGEEGAAASDQTGQSTAPSIAAA